ncbi:MAG TPA: XrtB/PEP-CTERM-associated polysaccharide biosynthesis outer membrane protein EpsL [Methylophilaceae bacterium]|jgi:exopolysaccharide biosynthesis operon protein EpsL|nr:XrtB/PEP-CTERM-associated polysaccharide biosynthesis outer membrane protein EpsL [Methylophilaceae bacterium]
MIVFLGVDKSKKSARRTFSSTSRFFVASCLAAVPYAAMAGGGTAYTGDPLDKIENTDTLNFILGGQVRYDSNLFRLSGSEDPEPTLGRSQKSDIIYTTNAGIRIDKPYSLQRFVVEAMVVDNRFKTYDFLDYTAFNYSAAWHWNLTPRITGVLLAEQKQEMNSFAEFREAEKNVQTSNVRLFTVDGDLGGGFHAIGGLLDVRARNSKTFDAVGDYQQDGFEVGGKYVASSQNWISLLQRETDGEYRGRELDPVAQLDSGFEQSETEANMFWRFTGKSSIDAKLGYLKREHDNFDDRDYSGMVGRLLYRWDITDKTQLNVSVARNLYSYQEAENSYYIAETFSISPVWEYSPKTTFRARYDYSEREYRGAIVSIPELRDDRLQMFLLAADWKATRNIIVTGALQRDKRSSNFEDFDYNATSASINAQFLF